MAGHIAPPVSHHVCNIGDIGNCYGLNNCLCHSRTSLIITTMTTSISALIIAVIIINVIASAEGVVLPMVALVLSLLLFC